MKIQDTVNQQQQTAQPFGTLSRQQLNLSGIDLTSFPGQYFIDTSMFIKTFLESNEYTQITRPFGWGKSFNLQLLKSFLEIRYDDNGKQIQQSGQMQHFAIKKQVKLVRKFFRKFPVLFLSFERIRNLKEEPGNPITEERVMSQLHFIISDLFAHHKYILKRLQQKVDQEQDQSLDYETAVVNLETFKKYLFLQATKRQLMQSLAFLANMTHSYHLKKVYILVDDYDGVRNALINQPGFNSIQTIVSSMLANAILSKPKNQKVVQNMVLMGTLKVEKDVPPNIKHYGLFSTENKYDQYFGLNELSVVNLVSAYSEGAYTASQVQIILQQFRQNVGIFKLNDKLDTYNTSDIVTWIYIQRQDEDQIKPQIQMATVKKEAIQQQSKLANSNQELQNYRKYDSRVRQQQNQDQYNNNNYNSLKFQKQGKQGDSNNQEQQNHKSGKQKLIDQHIADDQLKIYKTFKKNLYNQQAVRILKKTFSLFGIATGFSEFMQTAVWDTKKFKINWQEALDFQQSKFWRKEEFSYPCLLISIGYLTQAMKGTFLFINKTFHVMFYDAIVDVYLTKQLGSLAPFNWFEKKKQFEDTYEGKLESITYLFKEFIPNYPKDQKLKEVSEKIIKFLQKKKFEDANLKEQARNVQKKRNLNERILKAQAKLKQTNNSKNDEETQTQKGQFPKPNNFIPANLNFSFKPGSLGSTSYNQKIDLQNKQIRKEDHQKIFQQLRKKI